MRTFLAAFLGVVAGVCQAAKTYYVDCRMSDYAGHDGSSWELALETIQEGVNKASPGDTVLVAEGVYAKGGAVDTVTNGGANNRVWINRKAITLKGAGADKTFVVGEFQQANPPDPTKPLIGPDACRCICVTANSASESPTVSGLTMMNGACTYVAPGSDQPRHSGGGAYVSNTGGAYVLWGDFVDCVISNCVATRGGAMRGGSFHRCRIEDCDAYNVACAGRNMNLFNCLVVRNGRRTAASNTKIVAYLTDAVQNPSLLVNCTFCNNYQQVTGYTMKDVYNCVFSENASAELTVSDANYRSCLLPSGIAGNACFDAACVIPRDRLQLFAPALDDYRLASTSEATGKGSVDYLALIPEKYRDKDLAGNPRTVDGTVSPGCYESREAVPAAGAIVFTAASVVDGHVGCCANLHAFTAEWPKLLKVEPASNEKPLLYYACGGGCDISTRRYPKWDASCCYMMPPPAGTNPRWYSVNPMFANKTLWVDDDNAGGYAGADGSEFAPFETIQEAVVAAASTPTLVKVRPGTYRKGGDGYNEHFYRVKVLGGSNLRIVSTEGAAKTTILGGEDPSEAAQAYDGRGPGAYSCVAMCAAGAVQGFTLSGGRSGCDLGAANPDADGQRGYGAAFTGLNQPQSQLTDCIVTNCVGARGITYQGQLHRCWVVGNRVVMNGISRQSEPLFACVYTSNDPRGNSGTPKGAAVLNTGGSAYHCSAIGDATDGTGFNASHSISDSNVTQVNCVWQGFYSASAGENKGCVGNFGWELAGFYNLVSHGAGVIDNPFFASRTSLPVLRPAVVSPVIGGGSANGSNYYKYAALDFEGNPIEFVDGKPTAGAFMRPAASVFAFASGVKTGGISPSGTNVFDLAEGEVVRFTATAADRRPVSGFVVDGAFVSGATYDYTVPAVPVLTSIEVVYGTNWYVKAVGGSDANDGGSWDRAKATFEGTLANAVAGDVVTAGPGTYESGKMIHQSKIYSTPTLYSRLVVPRGVIVESAEGPEVTVIKGKNADVDDDEWHNGAGALRCAVVEDQAVLRGFTLTGGRTLGNASGASESDDNRGGGVYARNATSAIIENCILTNNVSVRGGGGFLGVYRRCRIVGNRGVNNGGSVRTCRLYDCYVDHNRGVNAAPYLFYDIVNTTIGADNATDDGKPGDVYLNFDAIGGRLYNSVVLAGPIVCDGNGGVISNTLYSTRCTVVKVHSVGDECHAVDDEAFQFTPDGRPVLGACAAIDAGRMKFRDTPHCTDADLAGGQRVYNGALDCGCYEADWRPRYAKIISRRQGTVGRATPEVTADAGHAVTLVDGSELTLTLDYPGAAVRTIDLKVAVTGEGVLTVMRNGEAWKTFAAGSAGTLSFETTAEEEAFAFSFAGTGSAQIASCRETHGLTLFVR